MLRALRRRRRIRTITDRTVSEEREDSMQNTTLAAALTAAVLLATGTVALAHVTVAPRQSKTGATERYTVRVPTEGQVMTTSVELEVPSGVTVVEVVPGKDYMFETRRSG